MSDGQVDAIIADLDRLTEREVIGLALEIDSILRVVTPVDTGWARANWVPTLGEPSPAVEGLKKRPTAAQVQEAAARQEAGRNNLLTYTLDKGNVFLTNGVPYIQKLNDGWSKQAPPAFVEAAVALGIANRRGME